MPALVHTQSRSDRIIRRLGVLLGWMVLLPEMGSASVVSRLDNIYFYDPLTFEAGLLQRGAEVRSMVDREGSILELGLDLPFYKEFVFGINYGSKVYPWQTDPRYLRWRFRIPVFETARFGWLSTTQLHVGGERFAGDTDKLSPFLEVAIAHSGSLSVPWRAASWHGIVGAVFRPIDQTTGGTVAEQIGVVMRFAYVIQLYRPPSGPGGKWTVTLSPAELSAVHYGPGPTALVDGRMGVVIGAPAVHFSHRSATYTLGFSPGLELRYGRQSSTLGLTGMMTLAVHYRQGLE